jgi:tetratricopeptide (TPR) repeat protein
MNMKNRLVRFSCIANCVLIILASHVVAQSRPDYYALLQQGRAQLQAGSDDLALVTANSAIKLDAGRWEAYALAGGALMNLKRYEEAADDFSDAIKRAPEAKQQRLRDLRKQCLYAEAGVPSTSAPAPVPATAPSPATTTQAEVVLWKSIESSANAEDFQTYLNQYPNGAFASLL